MALPFPSSASVRSTNTRGDIPRSGDRLVRFCDTVVSSTLFVVVLFLPLFVLPYGSDFLELPKQVFLFVGVAIASIAWTVRMLAERKFAYRRSPANVFVLLFVLIYGLSTFFSMDRFASILGDNGQESASFATILAFAVLYFVIASNVRTAKQISTLMTAWILSGLAAGVLVLCQGLGLRLLPLGIAQSAGFNTIGTVSALGIYLAATMTIAGAMLMRNRAQDQNSAAMRVVYDGVLWTTAAVSLLVICVIDYWPVTASLLLGSALLLTFAFLHAKSAARGMVMVIAPATAFFIAILLLFFRFPLTLGFPTEVMPSPRASMDIAMQTLRAKPLLGSGPGTFREDYGLYHGSEVNGTAFWNARFDRASSYVVNLFTMTGLLGGLAWLALVFFTLGSVSRRLFSVDGEDQHVLAGAFVAWFTLAMSAFVYSSSLTLEFAFWIALALLVAARHPEFMTTEFDKTPRASMGLSFLCIFMVVFSAAALFVQGERYAADVSYAKAVHFHRGGGSADAVVDAMMQATALNQWNDAYYRNLSVAYISQANSTASENLGIKREEKETDDAYGLRVQDARQQQLHVVADIASRAVDAARKATTLSPRNVDNWSNLGVIYQNLLGAVGGADEAVINAYIQSEQLEPKNPVFPTEIGKTYLFQADTLRKTADALKDDQQKKDAEAKIADRLGLAVASFNAAIGLKPDYAAAHYNLALALDRQGKLKDAIRRMEAVAKAENTDIGVGFQLALLYYRDGRKDEAITLLESVIKLAPNYSNARWYLGAMYEERGDIEKAIEQLQKVAELNPANDLVAQKLNDLLGKKKGKPGLPEPIDQSSGGSGATGTRR